MQQHIDENLLLANLRDGRNLCDAGHAAVGAAVGAGRGRVRAVVVDNLLSRGVGGFAVFVGGDVLGEKVAPVVVRVVVDVAIGVGGDARGADGADVVGFTVVVPGDDLLRVSWCWCGLGGRSTSTKSG